MDDSNIPTISVNNEISGHYSLEDSPDLADRLRLSFVEGADDHQTFLPFLTLSRILTKTCIEAHLKKQYGDLASQYADQIEPLYVDEADAPKNKPFPREVHRFLQHRVCDGDLPLTLDIRKNAAFRKGSDEDPLGCFGRFRPYQLESFEMLQWRFTTPFFHAPRDNNRIFYHDFYRRTILPWCRLDESEVGLERLGRHITRGAYGTIKPIVIDKSSHDFEKVLQGVKSAAKGIFALKTLRLEDRYEYDNEVEGLQRFNV
ncbi:serine threonine kinase [Fusarium denticulatum]|uniref:Serine threonine kinase n=1 Tax=Fusarium denticulatum TaxID=48507 RepID=A0A8H5WTP3_9HYPO|nr:serine threonine kinase [Fusarium denticulatum]